MNANTSARPRRLGSLHGRVEIAFGVAQGERREVDLMVAIADAEDSGRWPAAAQLRSFRVSDRSAG